PRSILVPVDFDDRETLATLLSERINHRVEIAVPQRGEKRSLVDLAGQNSKQSYIQRFRVLEPSRKAIQESLADSLMLPELPRRIECFARRLEDPEALDVRLLRVLTSEIDEGSF